MEPLACVPSFPRAPIVRRFHSSEGALHALDGSVSRFVFPHPNHRPPRSREGSVVQVVTLDVPLELRSPVFSVPARELTVRWALMPEAAVHEHCYLPPGEKNVRADPPTRDDDWLIDSKSPATAVER